MSTFLPGEKVIKRTEKDAKKWGTVMESYIQQKEGYVAVMFQRHVWIKPENLIYLDEWKKQRRQKNTPQSIKDFWTKGARNP